MTSRWDASLPGGSLKRAGTRAFAWSGTSQVGRQGLQLLVLLVLGRLLDSTDFGLIAMAAVVTGFVQHFRDLGTTSALIRQSELSEGLVQGVFWLNVGVGAACTLILLPLAPLIARAYGEPEVSGVLLALAPMFVLGSIGTVPLALLQRRLQQGRLAAAELIAVSAAGAAAIAAALLGLGPYSLVVQSLVTTTLLTALASVLAGWRPRARFAWEDVKPVVGYSANLTAFSVINYFARNADYALVGRFAGTSAAGYYYLAYRLVIEPITQVSAAVGRVAYPLLSTVQDEADRLRSVYLRVVGTIALACFPLALGLLAVAPQLLQAIRQEPALPLLALLVPVGLVQAVVPTVGYLYQVRGRADLMLRVGGTVALLLLASLCVGAAWGAAGVATAYALASWLLAVPSLAIPLRLVELSVADLFRVLARSLACAALMALAVRATQAVLPAGVGPLGSLAILVPLGAGTYVALSLLLNRERSRELIALARSRGA